MTEKKLIYIASPYAGNLAQNTEFAKQACRYCIDQGHTPVAVHLLYTQMLDDSNPNERKTGLELGRHVLGRCDEVWVCGNRISPGMAAEIAEASKLGIPIHQVSAEIIRGDLSTAYAIWAKSRTDSLLDGESGFLCEYGKLLTFPIKVRAEGFIENIQNWCLNGSPTAVYECVEYPSIYASDRRIPLEIIRGLDMTPVFDPNDFEVRDQLYWDAGCGMVATLEVYLADLDKTVWANCTDESVSISSEEYSWREEDELFYMTFSDSSPSDAGPWLPIIQKALEYAIERHTEHCRDGDTFPLPSSWLPDSLREQAEPEYLDWLLEQGKDVQITKGGRIEVDEVYLQDGQSQADIGSIGMQ